MSRFTKWNTIQDVINNFPIVKHFVHQNLIYIAEEDPSIYEKLAQSHSYISQLISHYGFDGNELIGRFCDGNELKVYSEIHNSDTEQQICMKMMTLIYYYILTAVSCGWMNLAIKEFCEFVGYLGEKVFPKFFECATKIHEGVKKNEAILFETGVESLEKWEEIILHFCVNSHSELLKCNRPIALVGFTEFFPPCFLLLTISQYYLERKNTFLKENIGEHWSVSTSLLLNHHFLYWNIFIDCINRMEVEESQKEAKIYYKNRVFDFILARNFIGYIYSFTENSSLKKKENSETYLFKWLGQLFHKSINHAKCILDLMENDWIQINNAQEDSTIISQKESFPMRNNYGKRVGIIKHKLLRMISSILTYDPKPDPDQQVTILQNKRYISTLFMDFVMKTLQKQSELESGDLLFNRSIITGLDCVSLGDLSSMDNNQSTILQTCNKMLFSREDRIREFAYKALGSFCSKTNFISSELLDSVVKSHKLARNDLTSYCDLLQGVAAGLKIGKYEITESLVESLKLIINNLFDTVCNSDTMEYLAMENNQDKTTSHEKNVNRCILLIRETYFLFNDNTQQAEKLLIFIKNKTEELSNYDAKQLFVSQIVPLNLLLVQICKSTRRDILIEIFNKLNYSFLFNLIHSLIKVGELFSYLGYQSMFTLIGILSDFGILHTNLLLNTLDSKENNFIYDYIMPILITEIGDLETVEEDIIDVPEIYLEKISQAFWALSRIIKNDCSFNNNGERSLSILNNSIGTLFESLDCFIGFTKRKQGLIHGVKLAEIITNALTTCLQNRNYIPSIAPKLVNYLFHLYTISMKKDKEFCLSVLEVLEYSIDHQIIEQGINEILWIEALDRSGNFVEDKIFSRIKIKLKTFDKTEFKHYCKLSSF